MTVVVVDDDVAGVHDAVCPTFTVEPVYPDEHLLQLDEPAVLVVPKAHAEQIEDAAVLLKVPTAQAVQMPEPAAL